MPIAAATSHPSSHKSRSGWSRFNRIRHSTRCSRTVRSTHSIPAIVPPSFLRGSKKVRRLFEDFESVERDYFSKTGIFPMMHTVGIRTEVYAANRWIAQALYKAFTELKSRAYDYFLAEESSMFRLLMTPWLAGLTERNRRLLGADLWPYGLEKNRKALETFLRYHHEQGLSQTLLKPEQLFAPETLIEHASYRPPVGV